MDPISGFVIRLVFTLPPKDSTLQTAVYKKCVHLWNNFPCISTLGGMGFIIIIYLGGLLDSDKYPGIGELWEMKFLQTIDQLELNRTRATALVSNSLKIQMLEVSFKIPKILLFEIQRVVNRRLFLFINVVNFLFRKLYTLETEKLQKDKKNLQTVSNP